MTNPRLNFGRAVLPIITLLMAAAGNAEQQEESENLDGRPIGTVSINRANVFDLSNPKENNWLYRWVNRLHIVTKERIVSNQLLFDEGQPFSLRLAEESERILRRNGYFFDASIEASKGVGDSVDVSVNTRDVWTLSPDLSLARSGGENRTRWGLEEKNLLGRGQFVRIARSEDVDRTSTLFEFSDRQLGNSWVAASLQLADSSDGHTRFVSIARPFYSLDARWSAGMNALDNDRRGTFYFLGNEAAEYQHKQDHASAFGGWSAGLFKGLVTRYTTGVVFDDNRFSMVENPALPALIPENRKLVYPFVGIEVFEDEFDTSMNHDQIGRTEDFYMGKRMSGSIGWSDTVFGADRKALVYHAQANNGFGSLNSSALLVGADLSGRVENGGGANTLLSATARYYVRQSEKRLFFVTAGAVVGSNLDLDSTVQLGGDTGLRGYPLRYQSGDSKFLATIEQRYFTDWYPFQLVRIGGAIFADAGRVWGDNPVGDDNLGWLSNVGLGLRFASTRSGARKVVHLDIAFPLNGDPSIDSVQILLESKSSF